jgi:hypothetical protein
MIVENYLYQQERLPNKIQVVCTFSDQNGNYSVVVLDTGNFTVSPQSVIWYNPSPTSHSANLSLESTKPIPSTILHFNRKVHLKMFV